MSSDFALYLHFPFCRRKCSYCSFVSYQDREASIPAYITALKREMALRAADKEISTIYLGGGTPSLISPQQVRDVLSAIYTLCAVSKTAEITMEANPGTVDAAYLESIRNAGVNRLSLGVQSLNDDELAILGRIHTATEARETVRLARKAGFKNLNIDLLYGIPGQTMLEWKHILTEAIELNTEHLSLYALTLEGDEPMSMAIKYGKLPDINPDLCAEEYELAEDLLCNNSFCHYEISNWAKAGYECKHNLVYWQNKPYIGAGVAAHSYMDGHRYANTKIIDEYVNSYLNNTQAVPDINELISADTRLAEAIILGLRLEEGINIDDLRRRFGVNLLTDYGKQLSDLTDSGLLEFTERQVRLTRRGRLLGNEVFWQFLPA